MASVSQNGRRPRRPWTAQDQIVAEVAAACGVSCVQIAKILDRSHGVVMCHLDIKAAKKRRARCISWQTINFDKHTEAHRQAQRRWRESNRNKDREISRRWQKTNPEKHQGKQRRWRNANPEKIQKIKCRWRKANPEKIREKDRRRSAWKRASRRAALHPVTRAQIDARFAVWDNRCAFCAVDASHERNHGRERLTVEHVLALTKGGLDEASNIIPACTACNSSKHNSPVEDWYRQQPWFTEARWRKIQRHCPAAVVGQLPLALAA